MTPVERRGDVWLKREDLFRVAGVSGGKARTCWTLAQGAVGLVTAGSRHSPQVNIVAHIARELRFPCRVHTPAGSAGPEVLGALSLGAERVTHSPGYNVVIAARAKQDAARLGWTEIPFGMEHKVAVTETRKQVTNLPSEVRRLVVPIGSAMSLAGVLWGLRDLGRSLPVLGVVVGADPLRRLRKWAPPDWESETTLARSSLPYGFAVRDCCFEGVVLDPIYEAKCVPFLQPGDCLWCVGRREVL